MLLLNTRHNTTYGGIKRNESIEEEQIKAYFGSAISDFEAISLAVEFKLWKLSIESDEELTVLDFINDMSGVKKLPKKPIFIYKLIERIRESANNEVKVPK